MRKFEIVAAGFVLAAGYWRQEKMKKLGIFCPIMAIIITLTGALNPIGMY